MVAINEITSQQTYPVRHPVLRADKPLESCRFDGDDLATTVHFGLFDGSELAGVASLFKASHQLFAEQNQYQLRGMAVLDAYQKKGYGLLLLRHAEQYAIQNQSAVLWFNARIAARGFYTKAGYDIIGKPFDIKDVGIHYVMHKQLL